jgi:phenylalanine ammonia-lyase
VTKSRDALRRKVAGGEQIYGVTTLFGGMADQNPGPQLLADIQRVALAHQKSTTGPRLAERDIRAAMLLRANSLMKGASGVRLELIERYATFLNAGAIPHAYERGSIGASGDLTRLSYIGGAIVGLDPSFKVDLGGETLDSHTALARLNLSPLTLEPKEGRAVQPEHQQPSDECRAPGARATGRARALPGGRPALRRAGCRASRQADGGHL